MKRFWIALLFLAGIASATDFQQLKLVDLSPYDIARPPIVAPNGNNPVLIGVRPAQGFAVTVASADISYTANFRAEKHFDPSHWIVGDLIPAKLDGDFMILKRDDGKEIKSKIVRRARLESKP
jgi:hypothetical protein